MLPLPDALLLFALHDDKGTVVSSAFLALDHTLRGGILAELRLRGFLQTRTDGMQRLHPDAPTDPLEPVLADGYRILRGLPEEHTIAEGLVALERGMPKLRELISTELARRGILGEATIERMGLPDDVAHPTTNDAPEQVLRKALADAIAAGDAVSPRLGTLVGLTVAAHLEDDLFDEPEAARDRAAWVAERDGILRAVREAVERVEGW